MSVSCPSCGAAAAPGREAGPEPATCPTCGVELGGGGQAGPGEEAVAGAGYATHLSQGLANAVRISSQGGATTLFQPSLLAGSATEASAVAVDEDAGSGTRIAPSPGARPRPHRHEAELYFLVLGAPPGEERVDLRSARTTFGRQAADVDLGDPTVSALHFQVDVMGREVFVRDLGSRNGTTLNGHPVRYSELLPGDELTVGETVLVFRSSEDGLTRPR